MNKHIKGLCFAALAVAVGAFASCSDDPVREGDPEYFAYTLSDVVMTQAGINTFDFSFSADCAGDDARVYLTEVDRIRPTDAPVNAAESADGDNVRFSFTVDLKLSEEYYLWVVSGAKEVMLPVTAPSMFPALQTRAAGGALFKFGYTFGVSWSSFCDPEGKAVYASDKSVFDDSATPIVTNVAITDDDCVLSASVFDADKYYYSVTTAKNGLMKIISAPVMLLSSLSEQITGISAALTGAPALEVRVTPSADGSIAEERAEYLQLVIKNNTGDEIYSADAVWADGQATMTFDCTLLNKPDLWYDLCLAYRGSIICDVPKLIGQTAVVGAALSKKDGINYRLTDWKPDGEDESAAVIKLYYSPDTARYADSFCTYAVSLDVSSGAPILKMTGTLKSGTAPALAITSGSESIIASAEATVAGNTYSCELDISSALTQADNWYDIRLFFGNICTEVLKDSCIGYSDFSAEYPCGGRVYSFREYDGLLKIMFVGGDKN